MNENDDDDRTIPVNHHDAERTLVTGQGAADQAFVPRTLGNYKLIAELGQGGQGMVYVAEDVKLGRKVALKMLAAALSLSEAARLRFEREAEAASKLDHKGIARIYELGRHDGIPFIAMELVQGESLAARISASRNEGERFAVSMSLSEVTIAARSAGGHERSQFATGSMRDDLTATIKYFEDAALALHAAHEAGLIHRDIKPGNMMVRPDGSACILDFGLARDEDSTQPALTQTGDVLGTPAYMSPEQVEPETRRIDRRTDVYSLGVSLYECATLQRPFAGATRQELYRQIVRMEPRRPRLHNARIPRDLEAIILTAIDKNPDRRYATAMDLAEDLLRLRRMEPIKARPVGAIVRGARWIRRNPAVSALVGTIILALGIGMFVVSGKNSDLRERSRQLESSNRQLIAKIEGERRALLEADGVASTIEAVLNSISAVDGASASNVTVRSMLDQISARLEADDSVEDVVRGRIHYMLGNAYWGLDLMEQSESHWLLSLEANRRAHPAGSMTMARTLHHLADLRTRRSYDGQVSTADAVRYLEEARGLLVRFLGEDSTEVRAIRGTAEAIKLANMTEIPTEPPTGFVQLLSGFHPEMTDEQVRQGLSEELLEASRLWASGDREGAADRLRFWIEPTLKGHPFLVNQAFEGIRRVADWSIESGYIDFGAGLHYERVRAARRVKGEMSPFVGRCMLQYALFLGRAGRLQESYSLHHETVTFLGKVTEPSNILFLDALDYLARSAAWSGKPEEARSLMERRMKVTLADVKPDDPIFADAWLMRSVVETQLDDPEAGLRVLEDGLRVMSEREAANNVVLMKVRLAEQFLRLGRRERAATIFKTAQDAQEKLSTVRKDVAAALKRVRKALTTEK